MRDLLEICALTRAPQKPRLAPCQLCKSVGDDVKRRSRQPIGCLSGDNLDRMQFIFVSDAFIGAHGVRIPTLSTPAGADVLEAQDLISAME